MHGCAIYAATGNTTEEYYTMGCCVHIYAEEVFALHLLQ